MRNNAFDICYIIKNDSTWSASLRGVLGSVNLIIFISQEKNNLSEAKFTFYLQFMFLSKHKLDTSLILHVLFP